MGWVILRYLIESKSMGYFNHQILYIFNPVFEFDIHHIIIFFDKSAPPYIRLGGATGGILNFNHVFEFYEYFMNYLMFL